MMDDGYGMMGGPWMMLVCVLVVVPVRRNCVKAGYSGWLSLLWCRSRICCCSISWRSLNGRSNAGLSRVRPAPPPFRWLPGSGKRCWCMI